jgi:hypothetical protein
LCICAVAAVHAETGAEDVHTINDFTGGYFKIVSKEAGVYNLDVGFNKGNTANEKVMAYGEINNDEKTDILTVQGDAVIRIYKFNKETEMFELSQEINDLVGKGKILSIELTDMTNDKAADLVVPMETTTGSNLADIYFLIQDEKKKFCS